MIEMLIIFVIYDDIKLLGIYKNQLNIKRKMIINNLLRSIGIEKVKNNMKQY